MKKMVAVLLHILMVFSLAACGGGSTEERTSDMENVTGTVTPTGDGSVESTLPEVPSEPEDSDGSAEAIPESGQAEDGVEDGTENEAEKTNILVVYFSATNITEGVAEMIADSLSADIYEIVPEQPYMDADLDYYDDNSRSTIEMNDRSARPAILGSVENMEQYSIVFIGYPKMEYGFNCVLCV